ncbi:hypothetical protein NC652_009563 [Populus alba x Populus x berolinensis]|nr:hypothetical protein NC652_009563 [Populus alba x Populus x berolinensis]
MNLSSFTPAMEMKRNKCTQPKQLHINLKRLPPVDPATTNPFPGTNNQKLPSILLSMSNLFIIKKDKPAMKYVVEGARAGPKEGLKQFDDEANTTADLLADNNPSQIIKTGDDSSTIKNTTKARMIKTLIKTQD